MRKVKIALGQMKPIQGSTELNIQKMKKMIKAAAEKHADIICFPELSYTGYFVRKEELEKIAEPVEGALKKSLSEYAKQYEICIIAGYAEREKDEIYNACLIINQKGKMIGNIRKVHLWKSEKKRFKAGKTFPVFDTGFGKIAVLNCYDFEFPESTRIVALKGAEIVFCPAAWSKPALNRWNIDLGANSLFNLLFVAGVNYVDEWCCGNSAISGPDGRILAQASDENEELLIVEIDMEEIEKQRSIIPYYKDMERELFVKELEFLAKK
ncbi:MAG: carbon-nitrogen hydrolase family protein [Clostridium sp.]